MKAESVTIQGVGSWNEDALVLNERAGLFGVIDGATSLVPYTGAGGETGGYLAARVIADFCNEHADSPVRGEQEPPPLELLDEANRRLAGFMSQAGIDRDRKEALWSACAVLIRIRDKWIEYAQAGDCMLAVFYTDGTIRLATRDQLAHVDDRTKEVWAQGVAAGLKTRAELWEYAKPQIIRGRELANSPGGYAVLNGEPEFADYAEYGRISRTNVRSLLLLSDGLYIPKLPGESDIEGATEIAQKVAEMGLRPYMDWLARLEESDPDCVVYPRVKKSDDKTAILIELEPDSGSEPKSDSKSEPGKA